MAYAKQTYKKVTKTKTKANGKTAKTTRTKKVRL